MAVNIQFNYFSYYFIFYYYIYLFIIFSLFIFSTITKPELIAVTDNCKIIKNML